MPDIEGSPPARHVLAPGSAECAFTYNCCYYVRWRNTNEISPRGESLQPDKTSSLHPKRPLITNEQTTMQVLSTLTHPDPSEANETTFANVAQRMTTTLNDMADTAEKVGDLLGEIGKTMAAMAAALQKVEGVKETESGIEQTKKAKKGGRK